jgi:DNA-binding MarR family transcriptional regulator
LKSQIRLKELRGGELKILRALTKKPPDAGLKFGELLGETDLSSPVLSTYLKNLQKKNYILRHVDSRSYSITREGRDRINKEEELEKIEFSSISLKDNRAVDFPSPTVGLDSIKWPLPYSKREANVDGYLFIDGLPQEKVTAVAKKLVKSSMAGIHLFFEDLGSAVAEQQGFSDNLEIKTYLSEWNRQEWLKWQRARLDYHASILLIFRGDELAKGVDWDSLAEKAKADYQRMQESMANIALRLKNDSGYRRRWLEEVILDKICFLRIKHPHSEVELVNDLVEMIEKFHGAEFDDSVADEVRAVFEDFKKSGLFKIVPEYHIEVHEKLGNERRSIST